MDRLLYGRYEGPTGIGALQRLPTTIQKRYDSGTSGLKNSDLQTEREKRFMAK